MKSLPRERLGDRLRRPGPDAVLRQERDQPSWEQFQLEVIQHEPGKFDAIDHGAIIDSRPISVLPSGVQDPPARVLISQHIAVEQGLAVTIMTIAWDAAPDAVAYDVEWRCGSREWVRVPRTGS